jgi:hypothetical protein
VFNWFRSHRMVWGSFLLVLLLGGGAFAYVKYTQEVPTDSVAAPPAAAPSVAGFKVELKNFPVTSDGHYAAWVINDQAKTLIGQFSVRKDGGLFTIDGKAIDNTTLPFSGKLVEGDMIEITLESSDSKGEQPSASVVMRGELKSDGSAELGFSAVDLSAATSKYVLATPTDDPEKNETSGLWFGMPSTKPTSSLNLPVAPIGWKYEGWVLYKDKLLSTGRFSEPKGQDSFNGYSATKKPTPGLAGQDFLVNAPTDLGFTFPINLADGASKAIISLEPDIGGVDVDGSGLFIPLFTSDIPAELKDRVATDMAKSTALPSAIFTYSQ